MIARSLGVATLSFLALAPSAARADDAACIAATEQSLSLRKQGKLHDALKQLATCADAACPGEIKAECSRRITEIDTAMPTLILAAKDGSGADLTAVSVSMDGVPLVGTLDGRALAIDPGEHTFRFETAAQPPLEKSFVLREGEKDRRESVVIGPTPTVTPGVPMPSAPAPPEPSHWSTQRVLAVVSGGLGIAGVAVGAVFGAFASSVQNREKSDCSQGACPNRPQAVADYDAASRNATGSTVAFAAGGVLLAGGVVLWLTAPSAAGQRAPSASVRLRIAPAVGASAGRVGLEGTF